MYAFRALTMAGIAFAFACSSQSVKPALPPRAPDAAYSGKLPLHEIRLPPGFKIDVYAEGVLGARSLCHGPDGILFVSTRDKGMVYALRDTSGDQRADLIYTLASGLNMPNGVAWRDGALYVAEVSRILRYDDIASRLANPPAPVVVYDRYPADTHHGWKYIAFGPDGLLYVPVGAPCNICEPENPIYCTITRLDPRAPAPTPEIVQRGIRNTVGFTWHPRTRALWFTDNGRDWMGDDLPACELNCAPRDYMHFGYPYCHQGDLPDPKYGDKRDCAEFTPPVRKLGPHVAPLGLKFYAGEAFPKAYREQVFIAEHGSWNRSKKIGYQVSLVRLDQDGSDVSYEPFATGWLRADDTVWGRPVDILVTPQGDLLVSDDYAHAIYRIYYEGEK